MNTTKDKLILIVNNTFKQCQQLSDVIYRERNTPKLAAALNKLREAMELMASEMCAIDREEWNILYGDKEA